MNQSQSQFAHLMNNYTSSTSEQQLLQQYLASASAFPHPHNLALHNVTNTLNGSTNSLLNNLNSLNNFAAFGNLAAVMASQQSNLTPSSLLASTNSSSTPSTNSLNQANNNSMFAVLLQAQQRLKGLNNLNSLNASNLLQKYDQSNNNNSQQSPSSVSNCSSPPTCSSVTPPTPPLVPTSTTLQLLAAQHYNLPLSTLASSTSSTNNTLSNSLSNSLSNHPSLTNTTNSSSSNNNLPASLSEAAAAVLSGQSNLNQLVANSQTLDSLAQKRLTVSPDDTSNELVDLQQYYQLNALSLLNSAGLTFNNNLNQLSASKLNTNQPIKDLAKIYSAINSASNLTDLNSPINSSLSSSSSSTNSLQNTMTSLQQHSQMMAAMASTNSFAHNPHMQLLSPNSIKTLKFSIENILNPSFGKNQQDLMNSLVTSQQQSVNLTSAQSNSLSMSKLLEFNKQQQQHNKNGLISSQTTNKLTNFINNNNTAKQKLKLEEINSNINGLSSIVNNLNPGLGALDFKLNSTKRKKRSSSSMDDSCEKDFDLTRNVKRKNSIDSDCSNSNSSGQTKLINNNQTDLKSINKSTNNQTDLNIKSPSSPKKNKLPTAEEIKAGLVDVPAWVLCTRYSDRPSSGPRSRKQKKKDKTIDEKRPRTAFTSEQLNQLKQEFISSPYLSDQKRMELSKKLQLNESQIKIWFQNKRAKSKKSSSHKSPLALQLSSQGLYNHSTVAIDSDDEGEENRSVNTEISNIKSPNCTEQTD